MFAVVLLPLISFSLSIAGLSVSPPEIIALLTVLLTLVRIAVIGDTGTVTKRQGFNRLDMAIGLFIIAVIVSVLLSRDVGWSVFWARGIIGFLLLYLVWKVRSSQTNTWAFLLGCSAAGTMAAAWGVTQAICFALGRSIPKHPGAVLYGVSRYSGLLLPTITGPFLNPDALGMFLVMTLPITFSCMNVATRRRMPLTLRFGLNVSGLGQMIAILLTGSTGCIFALLVMFLYLTCHSNTRHALIRFIGTSIVFVAFASTLILILGNRPFSWQNLCDWITVPQYALSSLMSLTQDVSISGRLAVWSASVAVWSESPLWGVGINGTTLAVGEYIGRPFSPHSLLFSVLGDMGLFGLAALILLYVEFWRRVRLLSHGDPQTWVGIKGAFISYLLVSLTTGSYVFDNSQALLWSIFGVVSSTKLDRTVSPFRILRAERL